MVGSSFAPNFFDPSSTLGIVSLKNCTLRVTHPHMSHLYSRMPRCLFTWFLASPSWAVAKLQILHMKGLDPAKHSTEKSHATIILCLKETAILIKHDCISAGQKSDFTLRIIFQCQAWRTVISSVLGLQSTSQLRNDFRIIETDALTPAPIKTTVTLQVPSSSSFTLYLSLSLSFISYLLFLCLWMRKLDSKGQGEYVNQFCVRSLPPIPSLKR